MTGADAVAYRTSIVVTILALQISLWAYGFVV